MFQSLQSNNLKTLFKNNLLGGKTRKNKIALKSDNYGVRLEKRFYILDDLF